MKQNKTTTAKKPMARGRSNEKRNRSNSLTKSEDVKPSKLRSSSSTKSNLDLPAYTRKIYSMDVNSFSKIDYKP